MSKSVKCVIIVFIGLLLFSCGHEPKEKTKPVKTFTVKKQPVHKTLFFTGTVQPLRESSLSCPVDAVIEKINYQYGQWVKRGDLILTLNSSALQKQYNDSLTEYLKAKDNYSINRTKFSGTQELWAAGLISKNNYLSEKSSLDNARVSLMHATSRLTELLGKMDKDTVPDLADLAELSFSEFDKVRRALTTRHNLIHIKAPTNGILLYPPQSSDQKAHSLTMGSSIKGDQVIGLIGDLSGIKVEIDVPEIDIDKIYTGMSATVSGIAFGKQQLKGKLVSINAQASNSGSGGLPTFSAIVAIEHLTPKQQAYIKIGMSASIELLTEKKNELLIPIKALRHEKGKSIVCVKDKKGRVHPQVVTTGSAEVDKVVVTTGLKEGDVVLYG